MRDLLRTRLSQVWPDLEIIGEAKNGDEAVQLVDELKPDLTFLDIRMARSASNWPATMPAWPSPYATMARASARNSSPMSSNASARRTLR
ncbi:hypothetical protein GCM10025794_33700 [Massilia kyonggiensis]